MMNGFIKKTAAVILAAAMILTSIPFMGIDISGFLKASAVVAKDENHKIFGDFVYMEETAYYSKTAGIKIVRYTGNGKNVVVPGEIDGKPVTCIGVFCFAYYEPKYPDRYWYSPFANQIESIELPDTVEVIDDCAFQNCRNLKNINIPYSVRAIRGMPFGGCKSLKEITLPGTDIYNDLANAGCFSHSALEKINLSEGMTKIPGYFLAHTNVTSLTIPSTVKTISDYAFSESKIERLVIPPSVKIIGDYAFADSKIEDLILMNNTDNNYYRNNISVSFYNFVNKKSSNNPQFIKTVSFRYLPDGFTEAVYNIYYEIRYDESGMWICEYNEKEVSGNDTEIRLWNGYNYYVTDDNKAVITKYTGSDTDVAVPEQIGLEKFPVVRIGQGAFKKTDIINVVIPDSVTEIGNYAFEECKKLKKVVLPDSLTQIGTYVFGKCSVLEEINWPSAMKYVPAGTFEYCIGIKDFNAFTGVEIICPFAFYDCKNLIIDDFGNNIREIGTAAFETEFIYNGVRTVIRDSDFSENLEYIGSYAFESCSFPDEIIISEKVDYIGEAAFICAAIKKVTIKAPLKEISNYLFDQSDLREIELPDSVEKIGKGAFSLSLLEKFEIPSNITEIDNEVFEDTEIKKIVIPSTVKRIGESAFNNCLSLNEIIIENGVETIGARAFVHCPATEFTIPESVTFLGDDVLKESAVETLYYNAIKIENKGGAKLNCAALKNVVFGDKVSAIPKSLFQDCSGIEEIVLPDGIEVIGKMAFKGCISLKDIILPDSLVTVEARAFEGCTSLAGIILPDSLATIESLAFDGCTALTEITLPEGLKSLNARAFSGCTGIKTVNFDAAACEFISLKETETDGIYYSPFKEIPSLEKINIGENVKELPGFLFAGIETIGEIELPPSVTDIGMGAFAFSSITSFKGTDNLESIEEYAFYGCENLTDVDLSSNIMLIGEAAFSSSGITEIYFPDSVTNIEMEVFKDCSALCKVRMSPNVDYIPREAFFNCTELSSFTWDSESKLIGRLAFGNCEKLIDFNFMNVEKLYVNSFLGSGVSVVQLGENAEDTRTPLTTIEVQSFKNCDNLQMLGVGGNVSSIKNQAFADCSNLETAVIADSVKSIANDAFDGCDKLTIYCSENSYAYSYAQANGIKVSTLTIAPIPNQIYTGFEIKPAVSVSASGNKLSENIDFGVAYSNNINVGNADVTVNGKGDFKMFSSKAHFTIITKSISGVSVASIPDQPYTGSAVTPELIVTDGLRVLSENEDYTLTYSGNTNEGTAKVKITGKGNYSGSASAQFNIVKMNDTQSFIGRFIYNAKVFFAKIISFITNIFSFIF